MNCLSWTTAQHQLLSLGTSHLLGGGGLVPKSCPTLVTPWTVACQAPLSMGFWTKILEWVAISFSRGYSWPRNWTWVSCIAGRFFTDWAMRKAHLLSPPHSCWQPCFWLHGGMRAHSLSCVWLFCDPKGCSPQGSSLHGVLQARKLEWVAVSSSRGSSWPRDWTQVSCVSCIGRRILYHWATWEASTSDFTEEMNTIRKETSLTFHLTLISVSVLKYSTVPLGSTFNLLLHEGDHFTPSSLPFSRTFPSSTPGPPHP